MENGREKPALGLLFAAHQRTLHRIDQETEKLAPTHSKPVSSWGKFLL